MQRNTLPIPGYTDMSYIGSTDGKWTQLSFQGVTYGAPDFSTPGSIRINEATSACAGSIATVNIATTELHISCTLPDVSFVDSSDSMRLRVGGLSFWANLTNTNQIRFYGNVGGIIHTFGPISYIPGATYTQHYRLTEVDFLIDGIVKVTFPIESTPPLEFAQVGFVWSDLPAENQITFFGETGGDDVDGAVYTQQYTSTEVRILRNGVVVATFPLTSSASSDPDSATIGFFQEPPPPTLPISGKPPNLYLFEEVNMYTGSTGMTGGGMGISATYTVTSFLDANGDELVPTYSGLVGKSITVSSANNVYTGLSLPTEFYTPFLTGLPTGVSDILSGIQAGAYTLSMSSTSLPATYSSGTNRLEITFRNLYNDLVVTETGYANDYPVDLAFYVNSEKVYEFTINGNVAITYSGGGGGATGATGNSSGNTGINNMATVTYYAAALGLVVTGIASNDYDGAKVEPSAEVMAQLSENGELVNGELYINKTPAGLRFLSGSLPYTLVPLSSLIGTTVTFRKNGASTGITAVVIDGDLPPPPEPEPEPSNVDLALKYVYGDTATQDVKITVYGEQVPEIEADETVVVKIPLEDLKGLLTFSAGATGSPDIEIEGESLQYPNIELVPSAVLDSRKVGLKAALRSRVRTGVFADDGSNDVHTLSYHLYNSTLYENSILDTSIPVAAIKKQDPQAVEIADLSDVIVPVSVAGGNSASLDDAKKVAVAALFEEAVAQGRVTLEDASPHLDLSLGDSITLYIRYDLAQTRRYAADDDVITHSGINGAQTVSLTFGGKTFDITFNNEDDDAKETGVGSKLYAFKFVASTDSSVFA